MKLWLISQTENSDYDTYDSAVVCAETADEARAMHPSGHDDQWRWARNSWCSTPEVVEVKEIGDAAPGIEPGVVLASYTAG